jgi:uridine kinase
VESAPKSKPEAFAVWITGLPACGKSTIAAALAEQFATCGVDVAVLESEVLRKAFAADQYDASARNTFYRQIAFVGRLLVRPRDLRRDGKPARLPRPRATRNLSIPRSLRRYALGNLYGPRSQEHLSYG